MSKYFQSLLVLLIASSTSRAILLVDDECSTDRLSCPENSECRPLSCRGYHCACSEGFMPDENSTACIKGTALDQKCGPTYPPCLNANAVCVKGLISLSPPNCQCEKGYINVNNLQCLVQTDYKRFGEWCEKECGPTLSCKLGFCQCQLGYRQITALEIQADPDYKYDCIENEFSLSKCKGEDVLLLSDVDANSLSKSAAKTSTDLNANYTDSTPSINQTTEFGNLTTTQYNNLTSPKADSKPTDLTTPTSVTLTSSAETSSSSTLISSKEAVSHTSSILTKIQTTSTMLTILAMTTVPPTQSSSLKVSEKSTRPITTNQVSTSTSPASTKATTQKAISTPIPVNQKITTANTQKTSTMPTKPPSSATPSQTTGTQTPLKTQAPTTTINIITSPVHISKSIPTQTTVQVPLSSPATGLSSSSHGNTEQAAFSPKTTARKTTHASTSSSVSVKGTPLPTIPSQSEVSTEEKTTTIKSPTTNKIQSTVKNPNTINTAATTKTPTTLESITTGIQNDTKSTPSNKMDVTSTAATQTEAQPHPSSGNRVATEAIVIPSVLAIVLAIVITSVIAVIVCKKRRSHISLSTDMDSSPYKVPRPSMTSQALTSSPYNNGDNPSYHYVNDAFENDRL